MTTENQENGVRKVPLIFIVSACGFVVAARTKQFQLRQSTSEPLRFPGAQWLTVGPCTRNQPGTEPPEAAH
jgi:hypothetical protein